MTNISEHFHTLPARYPELRGKVAVITGSASGVGKGIALRLAREGMRVVITGLDGSLVQETANQLDALGVEALAFPGDLSSSAMIQRLFDETVRVWGGVDLLVNNAADTRRVHTLDMSESLLDNQLTVNIRVPTLCAQHAARLMQDKGGGIVNITSVGAIRAHLTAMPYDMTKGAMDALTRSLAIELARYRIRANAIAPGLVYVERVAQIAERDPAGYARMVGMIPLDRPASAVEIGAMVAFLASDDAAYITGQVFYVDGGLSAQLSPPGQEI